MRLAPLSPNRRDRWHRVARWSGAVLAVLLTMRVDRAIMVWRADHARVAEWFGWDLLRLLGEYRLPTAACLLCISLDRRGGSMARRIVLTSLLAFAGTHLVKGVVVRERPSSMTDIAQRHWHESWRGLKLDLQRDARFEAFPSGHSAAAFAVAAALAAFYPRAALLLYGLAAGAAASRVAQGWHWPSDCVAGALLGVWSARVMTRLGARSNRA